MGQDHLGGYETIVPAIPSSSAINLVGTGAAELGGDERGGDYPLVRFLFALPSPLPVANGWAIGMEPGVGSPPDCPMAFLTFWQEEYSANSSSNRQDVISHVEDRLALGHGSQEIDLEARDPQHAGTEKDPDAGPDSESAPPRRRVTVVDAITRWESLEHGPDGWDGQPENLDPKFDPIVRCVALARQVSRAFRLIDGRQIDLISYERLPLGVVLFSSKGRVDRERLYIAPSRDWHVSLFLNLNHWNLPLDLADHAPSPATDYASGHWMTMLRSGTPAVRARELMMEASLALRQLGEYSEAVVKANTSSEVMLDAFLSAMLWEEHFLDTTKPDAKACGGILAEGKVKVRMQRMLAPRLKGDWTSPSSPVVKWLRGPHALRHRIVHGGYEPTRQEASDALSVSEELSVFMFNRLAAQRNKYKRVAVLFLGVEGLQQRDLLKGQIERFLREVAPTEVSHLRSWGTWQQQLVASAATE